MTVEKEAGVRFASVGVRNWLPTFFTARDFPYYSVFFMNAMDLAGCLIGAWGAERYGCVLVIAVGFVGSPYLGNHRESLPNQQRISNGSFWVVVVEPHCLLSCFDADLSDQGLL